VRETATGRASIESLGAGRFRVSGVLNATTARAVLEQSESHFEQFKDLEVDLSGVGDSDSAGLALLIEWLRLARQWNKKIHFANVPPQIEALARTSEVEDLIGGSEQQAAQKAAAEQKVSG
jgi:phospholipid transport system transporter-binding protein